ncbi:hypothetical protein RKS58_06915 [Lysinibacillus capsici]|uniref:hypothetical protein n=1 Tax=Lysinibacillus capsici TaxID=2115968 RepID=UPI0028BE7560|nr:hypothetical protein [Lysinibacillus capsici]WNN77568.1 hypothetical protein RKS58_06915 [Lysinibacillus capsici]
MAVYSVTYDLNKAGQNYPNLIKKLETFPHCKYQQSAWLVKSNLSAQGLYEQLKPYLDTNDFILVIPVTNQYYGWMPPKTWDEIKALFN